MQLKHHFTRVHYIVTLIVVLATTASFLAIGYYTDPFTNGLTGSRFVVYFGGYEILSRIDPSYMRHLLTTADLSKPMTFAAFSAALKYTLAENTVWQYLQVAGANLKFYFIYWVITTFMFAPMLILTIFGLFGMSPAVQIDEESAKKIRADAARAYNRR